MSWRRPVAALRNALPLTPLTLGPLRASGLVPERIYRHLPVRGVFRTRLGSTGFRMRGHGDRLENELFWSGIFGDWEGTTLDLWLRAAMRAEVILDVGANTGLFALSAQAVRPEATVAAFEALPRVHERLAENCRLNGGRVEPVGSAVSDSDGTATFWDPGGENAYAGSFDPGVFGDDVGQSWTPREIPTLRLEGWLDAHGVRPDLLKVDVEGHEPAVLRGLGKHLTEARPDLFLEVLTPEHGEEIHGLLGDLGYRAWEIDDVAGARPSDAWFSTAGRNLYLTTAGELPPPLAGV